MFVTKTSIAGVVAMFLYAMVTLPIGLKNIYLKIKWIQLGPQKLLYIVLRTGIRNEINFSSVKGNTNAVRF